MGIKNVDVFWLKQVPEGWKVLRVKDLFSVKRGRVISKTELIDEGRYPVYSAQTENNGIMGYINTFDFKGDYLTWTTDGIYAGTVFRRTGEFNCTNVCGTLKLKKEYENEIDLDFIFYVLKEAAPHYKRDDINGGKLMSNEMEEIVLVYPEDINKQKKIAKNLKTKDSTIASLIKAVENKIVLVDQYWDQLVFSTIFKKNKEDQSKDSNTFWIDRVSKDWEIFRIKNLFDVSKGKNASLYNKEYISDLKNQGENPVYSGQTENDGVMGLINSFEYDIPKAFVITTVGAKAMVHKRIGGKFTLSQNCALITFKKKNITDTEYLFFDFLFKIVFGAYQSLIPSHMQPSLKVEDLINFEVYLPKEEEMKKIISILEDKKNKVKEIRKSLVKKNELLKTLMTSYVVSELR